MTKEVEVGDSFQGKVVKTTTFGAFVELAKGTDGLLHISNVSPGQRVGHGRGRPQQGRRDRRPRGRGRPRARPHRPAPRRGPRDRRQVRRGAGRASAPAAAAAAATAAAAGATATATAAAATAAAAGATATAARARRAATATRTAASARHLPDHRITELDSGLRIATEHMSSVRSAALGFFVATGSRGETRRRGRALALPRAPAVPRHRPLRLGRDRPAVRRHGRRAQRRHRQGDHHGLRADARPAPADAPST